MIDLSVHPKVEWRKAKIPKKSGGFRELIIPGDELKAVQKNILEELYVTENLDVTSFAAGFIPYRNTIYGAMKHAKDADYIIELDVHDFFPTFDVEKVRPYLMESGLGVAKVDYIMKYCVYEERGNRQFPQGAPTSPYLTNIGMKLTDLKLNSLAASEGLTYSRYADDLTFATTEHTEGRRSNTFFPFIKKVEHLLAHEQRLYLSPKKTRVIFKNSPRVPRRITGVVLRKDGLGYNAPKRVRHKARCLCHILWKKLQDKEDIKDLWPMYREMKGLICYCDYLRSFSDGDASTADPVINPLKFNFIEERFNAVRS